MVMILKLTHVQARQLPWYLCYILVLIQLHVFGQNVEIRDCNGKDIITHVTVRSSINQQLTLTNCTYTQGKLSEYLNCIQNNNPTLPANSSLVVTLGADPASGISAADLTLLKQEILQLNNITNICKRVGSDADLNNKLNTIDLCLIKKHNLGISNINPSWKFYRSQNLSLTGIGTTTDLVFPIVDFPLSPLNILAVDNGNVNQVTTSMDTCVLLCKPDLRITQGQDEVRKLTTDYFLLNKTCNFPNLSLQILNASGQVIGNEINDVSASIPELQTEGDSCCYSLDLVNDAEIQVCEVDLILLGWTFKTGSVQFATNFILDNRTASSNTLKHSSGSISHGSLNDILQFWISGQSGFSASQLIVVKCYETQAEGCKKLVCADTLITHCVPGPDSGCIKIVVQNVECTDNPLIYKVTFHITNLSDFPMYSIVVCDPDNGCNVNATESADI